MDENILDQIKRIFDEERPELNEKQESKPITSNLKRPPGLVGEVTDFINSQCRYPRENLAVAAAIFSVGNIGGLTHKLDNSKIASNLFMFGIAGSATGKEAVLQAVNDLHIEAGIAPAVHGSIKSEQEIVRNLIRHQAALYNIDEIGLFLRKLNQSHKQGGAAYLQGVIGVMMAAYSKAGGNFLLSGDLREDLKDRLKREFAALNKQLDNGEGGEFIENEIESIKQSLIDIDQGLKNPFLSVMGFSTPSTFDESVSFEQVTSGFIGRSIIINEPNNNPKRKRGFVAEEMPKDLINRLLALRSNGEFDKMARNKIKSNGHFMTITTGREVIDKLEEYADWFEDEAERHTERTGFEAVVRRGYEMVEKISFILAFGGTERTLEHIEWSFDYIRRDISYKTLLAYSNVKEKSDPIDAMAAKIMSIVDDSGVITAGKIKNRYRSKIELVQQAVEMLERKGKIRIEERSTKHSSKPSQFIFRT